MVAEQVRPRGRVVTVWDGREYQVSSIHVGSEARRPMCSLRLTMISRPRRKEEGEWTRILPGWGKRISASLRIEGSHELIAVLDDFTENTREDNILRIDFTDQPQLHWTAVKRS